MSSGVGLHGCKLDEVLETSRRRNKEWFAKKEAGNDRFRSKAYKEAIAFYEEGFFIAAGRQTMTPFLLRIFNRTKPMTPTFRLAQILPLIDVVSSFVEYDFKPTLWSIPVEHRKIMELVFPNLGAGQCASNIAQCLLNLHKESEAEVDDADELLNRALWWAQVSSKVFPEFVKSYEREVEALARLSRSQLISPETKQDLRRRLVKRREELQQRRELVVHFQQVGTYMQPEVYAAFMLRNINLNTFSEIYGLGTMREALRAIQRCAAPEGEVIEANRIQVNLQLSLVPVRGQYLSFSFNFIDNNWEKHVMSIVQTQMCDPHPTSGDELEQPPHGHATEQAMESVWNHLDRFLKIVEKFPGVSLSSVMLGQGLVGKTDMFTSFLREKGNKGAFVYDALSTHATQSSFGF